MELKRVAVKTEEEKTEKYVIDDGVFEMEIVYRGPLKWFSINSSDVDMFPCLACGNDLLEVMKDSKHKVLAAIDLLRIKAARLAQMIAEEEESRNNAKTIESRGVANGN